jgi:hypothetical protein
VLLLSECLLLFLFRYRLSPETFGYTLVLFSLCVLYVVSIVNQRQCGASGLYWGGGMLFEVASDHKFPFSA